MCRAGKTSLPRCPSWQSATCAAPLKSEQTPSCADRCGSSRLHLAGTVDEVSGASSGGRASGVGAVVVVVVEGVVEVAAQAAVADLQEARKGGAPALFEDRAVQAFDVAVGLRAPGSDLAVLDAFGEATRELAPPELVAVIGEHALEAPAGCLEL